MGLLDAFAGGSDDTATENRYAILLSAGPDNAPVANNAFNYALEFDDAGYEVQVFLDGQATKWPSAFEERPDLPFSYDWEQIEQRGLLAGACGYCANAFDVVEACERSGIELLSDETEHAPSVADLADEGYEMLTIG
ncbi:DsrE family protein [Haloarcula salinisoli]|uniref:DsrE family protein n=1 Tax=Haloarcula salinisoli TaxID=2487746 RepID=A0A8J7YJ28_9EURY|nr:DsrE family protein [Halomicroarcula salinisoli]MBX0304458.1 DsrE family protein [Halomicroarcula salinisoli]